MSKRPILPLRQAPYVTDSQRAKDTTPDKPFFNPEDCPFENAGFFEEFLEPESGKLIGIRVLKEATRPLGSDGRTELVITEEMWLKKGHRRVILKASPQKPKRVVSMIQVLCGFTKFALAQEAAEAASKQNK